MIEGDERNVNEGEDRRNRFPNCAVEGLRSMTEGDERMGARSR